MALSKEVVIGLSVLGGAAILGIAYVVATQTNTQAAAALLAANPAPSSGTQVSTLNTGTVYDLVAVAPVGTPNAAGLAALLNQSGWSNAAVTNFTAAGATYNATATWAGANGAAVPAGATATVH